MTASRHSRRNFLKSAAFGSMGLALSASLYSDCSGSAKKQQNILCIAVDDLRPELGCFGHSQIISPNIDRLASEGTKFVNAYCNVPVCGASRASLMTGVRPLRRRFIDFDTWGRIRICPITCPCPDILETMVIVRYHLEKFIIIVRMILLPGVKTPGDHPEIGSAGRPISRRSPDVLFKTIHVPMNPNVLPVLPGKSQRAMITTIRMAAGKSQSRPMIGLLFLSEILYNIKFLISDTVWIFILLASCRKKSDMIKPARRRLAPLYHCERSVAISPYHSADK
jgi:hypothetical protein